MALSYHDWAAIERLNCMQLKAGLHKRNPAISSLIRDTLDFQGGFGWHSACMHFQL